MEVANEEEEDVLFYYFLLFFVGWLIGWFWFACLLLVWRDGK